MKVYVVIFYYEDGGGDSGFASSWWETIAEAKPTFATVESAKKHAESAEPETEQEPGDTWKWRCRSKDDMWIYTPDDSDYPYQAWLIIETEVQS